MRIKVNISVKLSFVLTLLLSSFGLQRDHDTRRPDPRQRARR